MVYNSVQAFFVIFIVDYLYSFPRLSDLRTLPSPLPVPQNCPRHLSEQPKNKKGYTYLIPFFCNAIFFS